MPDDLGVDPEMFERSDGVAIAVRTAEADDCDGHSDPPVGEPSVAVSILTTVIYASVTSTS